MARASAYRASGDTRRLSQPLSLSLFSAPHSSSRSVRTRVPLFFPASTSLSSLWLLPLRCRCFLSPFPRTRASPISPIWFTLCHFSLPLSLCSRSRTCNALSLHWPRHVTCMLNSGATRDELTHISLACSLLFSRLINSSIFFVYTRIRSLCFAFIAFVGRCCYGRGVHSARRSLCESFSWLIWISEFPGKHADGVSRVGAWLIAAAKAIPGRRRIWLIVRAARLWRCFICLGFSVALGLFGYYGFGFPKSYR